MMMNEVVDAVVVQSDGVEHSRRGLDRAWRLIAGPRMLRHRLGNDSSELGEIDDPGHLAGVAKSA